MAKSYCLKERKLTENVNPRIVKTKNNRLMELAKMCKLWFKKS